MSMLQEFKNFAVKGNVVDMAVGIVIGGAFGKIVSSFVGDVLMPPIGRLLGSVDFKDLFINLSDQEFASLAEAQKAGAPTLNYGVFVSTILDFVIIAFAVFVMIKQLNRVKRPKEVPAPAAPTTKDCGFCYSSVPIKASRCPHCTSQLQG